MSKKDAKFNMLLDGFLRSKTAQSLSPEELEDLLKSVEGKGDADMQRITAMKCSELARHCEENLRRYKIVLEDMVSVLVSAYRNGCLDDMIENASKCSSDNVQINDVNGVVDMEGLSEEDKLRFEEKAKHGRMLFSKKGMEKFLDFVEKDAGQVFLNIWEDIGFLNHTLEAMVAFEIATPEEIQKGVKSINKIDGDISVKDVPEIIDIDKEVLN